ncbi:MAG TPA: hypothetical protein DCZ92_11835 [Elusimicrobia bacterium]|nr:hypothetical protein [Elusimicrobiota bacterium]
MNKTFKIALACFWYRKSVEENLKALLAHVKKAAAQGCDMVCFGEAVFSGMPSEDYARDLKLAISLEGPQARAISRAAADNNIWIAFGAMEKSGGNLSDTAVLYNNKGRLVHRYARISRGWLTPRNKQKAYRMGKTVQAVKTPFGRFAFEICGDIFDAGIRSRLRALSPDYLLCLMWRSFASGKYDQAHWDKVEKPEYLRQLRSVGSAAFFVNTLSREKDEHTFGGPMSISNSGKVLKEARLGKPALLVCEAPVRGKK